MYPPGADDQECFTWAASYPPHVSGVDILVGVEAQDLLESHACDIFHSGISIPTIMTPAYWMLNGHSFVAVFHDLSGGSMLSQTDSTSAAAASSTPVVLPPRPLSNEFVHFPEEGEESPPVSSSSFDEEELQGLQVCRL